MGKGDKKSRRGKIHIGSHGARRPRKRVKTYVAPPAGLKEKPAPKAAKPVEVVVETVAEEVAEVKKTARKTTKKAKEETASE